MASNPTELFKISIELKEKISSMWVLIVEDNKISQQIAQRLFKEAGIRDEQILIASDGATALQSVKERPFNIIYMDCNMPGEPKGPEATLKIRSLEKEKKYESAIIFTCSTEYEGVYPGANTRFDKKLTLNAVNELVVTTADNPDSYWNSKNSEYRSHSTNIYSEGAVSPIKLNPYSLLSPKRAYRSIDQSTEALRLGLIK